MITEPMLAGKVKDAAQLHYPVIASPKIDGIRCLKIEGHALTRSFKSIPNRYVHDKLLGLPDGLDGELLVPGAFQATTSGIMSRSGEPKFTYNVFDHVRTLGQPFSERLTRLERWFTSDSYWFSGAYTFVKKVPQVLVKDLSQLEYWEKEWLEQGYEGAMVRDPKGPYKCGRSTWREGWLLKLKRFEDAEAIVIGYEELQHNLNEATENEFGRTKRSSAKDGKLPAGTLGKLRVRGVGRHFEGVEFSIGVFNGVTAEGKLAMWKARESLLGRLVKYRFQQAGVKDKPRIPVFLGFRDELDVS